MMCLELCRITWTQQKVLKTEKHSTCVKPRTKLNQIILITWQPDYHACTAARQQFSPIPGSLVLSRCPGHPTVRSDTWQCAVWKVVCFSYKYLSFLVRFNAKSTRRRRCSHVLYGLLVPSSHPQGTDRGFLFIVGGTHDMVYLRLLTTATRSNVSMCLSAQVWWRLTHQLFHKWYKSLPSQKL
jgi:hypothetical protein